MSKRKLFIIISALISIIYLFAACNTRSGNMNSKNSDPPKEQNSSSEQKAKEDPSKSQKTSPKKENKAVAVFSTKIIDYDENRIHNIRLASEKINSCVIKPGQVFSFNEIVGKREYGKGYRKATILVNGEQSEDVGGGICQLSSTIYNAALKLNLEIVERHDHSGDVHYIQKGQDAAVNYGDKDLKFKNTKNYPIKFKVTVGNGKVSVSILKG